MRAIDAPGSPTDTQVTQMRDFLEFVGVRVGQLLRKWEAIKAGQAAQGETAAERNVTE